jgi:hypothetical protein
MQITKITSPEQLHSYTSERMTTAQLQNEYNYIRAEQITRKMLKKGLISSGEYDRIMAENRRTFSPYLADLYPDNALL